MTESDSNKKPQENPDAKQDSAVTNTDANGNNQVPDAQTGKQDPQAREPQSPKVEAAKTADKESKPAPAAKEAVGAKEKKDKEKTSSKPQAAGKPKRQFPIVAVLALLVGGAAVGAGYYNYTHWQKNEAQGQSLAKENAELRSQLSALQEQISGLHHQDLDFKLKDEQLDSDFKLQSDSLKQLSQQFQAMSAEQGRDPLLWRVSEVEYLLSVANNRLQLERDTDTALVALQDADRRLQAIGDPALIPIRKTIAGEITALNSVDKPDITGMALRLSALVDGIENLPLVNRARVKSDKEKSSSELVNSFSQFWANVVKDLKGVVSIRRSDEPIEPLLPPDEQYYLSQNLGLKLEEARLALLRRDTHTFRLDLTDTRQWVEQYFDRDSAAVGNVITSVTDMQTVNLKPQLPDISGSLRQLRHWMALQQQSIKSSANASVSGEDKV
jgi:uroporphyrin-3 C-methyltransferase